jgi:hypothetical protein
MCSNFRSAVFSAMLLGVTTIAHAQGSTATRTVHGQVYDSLAHAPLVGAQVNLVSADSVGSSLLVARSNSSGAFEFRSVAAGMYLIGFTHPLLDSLGIGPPVRRISIPADQQTASIRADLAIPGPRTLRDAICPAPAAKNDSLAVLVGHLRDADLARPLGAGRVTAQWSVFTFADGRLSRTLPTVSVRPNADGWFAFCGLPVLTPIALVSTRGNDSSGVIRVELPPRSVWHRELYVGASDAVVLSERDSTQSLDSAAALPLERVRRGAGRLEGSARDARSGLPLTGVQLTIQGSGVTTTASSEGTFALSQLPLGSQVLLARKVGYAPVEMQVDVLANAIARADVALPTLKSVLDTVKIIASHVYAPDRNGFRLRQKSGMGKYFDADQIAGMHVFETSDLLNRVPGTRVGVGLCTAGKSSGPCLGDKVITMSKMFGGRCSPAIFIDGMQWRGFSASDLDSFVEPERVGGMEVYNSASFAPAQFSDMSGCGSVVIWTRQTPSRTGRERP